ncbi:SDR family oxidoreductase [Catenovulum maritimum]|uniref:Malonic semialdehyde reductase n=1 Tax=Catenovulum maritimum TaxID=1513271 RepID=A0A0J8GNZ0_9ALTE|nr:SDR family oxidoreductase [Catenovulum maritimum]KMT64515.1 malonic semialdehyde reductase [Catenovulum maritimum]
MKTVLITGATAGFGEAAAKRFIKEGWQVIGTGRRAERLSALQAELGDNFFPLAFDIRDFKAVESAISSLPEQWQKIDTLVNNAGLALGLNKFDEGDISDWETMIDTNIKGLLYVTKTVLAKFIKQEQGHVINLGSTAGTYPYPGSNVYGSTKAFVNMFSLELRADITGKNIRVTCIEPGYCETEFAVVRFKGDVDKASNFYQGMEPLTADDIAESIYWSASLPPHMNVNKLELMPTRQTFAGFNVERKN